MNKKLAAPNNKIHFLPTISSSLVSQAIKYPTGNAVSNTKTESIDIINYLS